MIWGVGFPQMKRFRMTDVCNYVESLLWSEMFRFNGRFHFMYSPRLRDARANVSVRVRCDPSGICVNCCLIRRLRPSRAIMKY